MFSLLLLLLIDDWVCVNAVTDGDGTGDNDDVNIPFACCRAAFRAMASNRARFANVSADGGRPRFRPGKAFGFTST